MVFFLSTFFSVVQQTVEAKVFERCASKGASNNLDNQYENFRLMKSMLIMNFPMTTMSV